MHDVRPSRPMGDVCYLKGALTTHGRCVCIPFLFEAYATHYYRMIKLLKLRERNSVIVMAEKLLTTL